MNGWDEGHPSWWLNVEAHPDVTVRMAGGERAPGARVQVEGEEQERLWKRWAEIDEQLDGYAGMRTVETPVVVLEPRERAA